MDGVFGTPPPAAPSKAFPPPPPPTRRPPKAPNPGTPQPLAFVYLLVVYLLFITNLFIHSTWHSFTLLLVSRHLPKCRIGKLNKPLAALLVVKYLAFLFPLPKLYSGLPFFSLLLPIHSHYSKLTPRFFPVPISSRKKFIIHRF